MRRLVLLLMVATLLGGCGGSDDGATTQAQVYFLRDGKVWPVAREVQGDPVAAVADELFDGPTTDEREMLEASTAIPGGGPAVSVQGDVATLVNPQAQFPRAALAQIVYTLTQFPTIESVEIGGSSYTRPDFEAQTPSVLVESPLPFAAVTSPIHATGTANTFEANFEYEVKDSAGEVVDTHFVTATSGTGTRGTFDFTTKAVDDPATLLVFEASAEDGSRIHEVEIPLTASS